jgi:hypothetical protein
VFVHFLQSWRSLPGSKTKATTALDLYLHLFVCFSSGSSGFSFFFLFLFSVLLVVPFLSSLSSPSSRYSLFFFVPLPFSVSLLPILCFLTLSLYLSLFLFFSKDFPPFVSFSLCCPVLLPSRSFFYVFSLLPSSPPPRFSLLLLLLWVREGFVLVTICRGMTAVTHAL